MKARALVLMLCISLMCSTGFGFTTTDLTENSTTDIVQMDEAVSVVSLEAEFEEVQNLELNKASAIKIFVSFNVLNDLKQSFEFANPESHPVKYEGDVGWQLKNENYNYNQPAKYHRNPRDGLRC